MAKSKSKPSFKGKGPRGRGKGRSTKTDDRSNFRSERGRDSEDTRGVMNDISWYSRYPNLLNAAGSFPFPYRPGMQINFGQFYVPYSGTAGQTSPVNAQYDIPGVIAMDWIPSIGQSQLATDPASVLGKELYARVRSMYSGSLVADGPDFVIYLLALDSIFAYIAWLKRLYRVMNTWTPENYVLPEQVLKAMGLLEADIQNFRTNRTQLWQMINELVLQTRKFKCPAVIDLFNRHYWMSDNVYSDSPELSSQFYLFNPRALFTFGMVNDPQGNPAPGLVMKAMPNFANQSSVTSTLQVSDLYNYGLDMINALSGWDESYDISGYLSKAFDGQPVFIVEEIEQNPVFNIAYSEEVLTQIENSFCVPHGFWAGDEDYAVVDKNYPEVTHDFTTFNVSQDPVTNAVLATPSFWVTNNQAYIETGNPYAFGTRIPPYLTIRSAAPTVAETVVSTRLKAYSKVGRTLQASGGSPATDKSAGYQMLIGCGTEVPLCWRRSPGPNDGVTSRHTIFCNPDFIIPSELIYAKIHTTGDPVYSVLSGTILEQMSNLMRMEAFDWHPTSVLVTADKSASSNALTGTRTFLIGDVHNTTVISRDDLDNLHKVCIYSEMNSFSVV